MSDSISRTAASGATKNALASCAEAECALHGARSGLGDVCRNWNPPQFDLESILGSAPLQRCPVMDLEVLPIVRQFARRWRRSEEDVLGSLVMRILDASRAEESPKGAAELNRALGRLCIDEFRRERGRMRCAECLAYDSKSRQCGRRRTSAGLENPHYRVALNGKQNPHHLTPPCFDFDERRKTLEVTPDAPAGVRETTVEHDKAAAIEIAMKRLLQEDAVQHAVVAAVVIDEMKKKDVASRTGMTIDQVRYAFDEGIRKLERWLRNPRTEARS